MTNASLYALLKRKLGGGSGDGSGPDLSDVNRRLTNLENSVTNLSNNIRDFHYFNVNWQDGVSIAWNVGFGAPTFYSMNEGSRIVPIGAPYMMTVPPEGFVVNGASGTIRGDFAAAPPDIIGWIIPTAPNGLSRLAVIRTEFVGSRDPARILIDNAASLTPGEDILVIFFPYNSMLFYKG